MIGRQVRKVCCFSIEGLGGFGRICEEWRCGDLFVLRRECMICEAACGWGVQSYGVESLVVVLT